MLPLVLPLTAKGCYEYTVVLAWLLLLAGEGHTHLQGMTEVTGLSRLGTGLVTQEQKILWSATVTWISSTTLYPVCKPTASPWLQIQ